MNESKAQGQEESRPNRGGGGISDTIMIDKDVNPPNTHPPDPGDQAHNPGDLPEGRGDDKPGRGRGRGSNDR